MKFIYTFVDNSNETYRVNIVLEEGDDRSEVVIPDAYNGKKVTHLTPKVFDAFGPELKTIVLGENIEVISPFTLFSTCTGLETIYFGKNIKTCVAKINTCENLKNVFFNGTKAEWEEKIANGNLGDFENLDIRCGVMYNKVQLRQGEKAIYPFTHWDCIKGKPNEGTSKDGLSAYEVAVKNGFEGSETEWLNSLNGKNGESATINGVSDVQIDSSYTVLVMQREEKLEFHVRNQVDIINPDGEGILHNLTINLGCLKRIPEPVRDLGISRFVIPGNNFSFTGDLIFTTVSNVDFALSLPDSVKWAFDTPPTFERGKTYHLRFTAIDPTAENTATVYLATCTEVTI